MKGFKQCSNGHFYKDNLQECPYCPPSKGNSVNSGKSSDLEKTMLESDAKDAEKTIFDDDDLNKTQVMGDLSSSGKSGNAPLQEEFDPSKTHVMIPPSEKQGDSGDNEITRATRKIVGWLISYTIDPMGRDYRLYEGRNTIGKGMNNSIIITNDPAISSNHLMLLYNNSNYYISDEMSGNGTKINGEFIRPKDAINLNDGDLIEIGHTVLKFRTSF
jgi:hypothetical protein